MTEIEVEDGLSVRFPGRETAFLEGVEIGLLLAEMVEGPMDVIRRVRSSNAAQARELATSFGYRTVTVGDDRAELVEMHFTKRRLKPRLLVV